MRNERAENLSKHCLEVRDVKYNSDAIFMSCEVHSTCVLHSAVIIDVAAVLSVCRFSYSRPLDSSSVCKSSLFIFEPPVRHGRESSRPSLVRKDRHGD